jgi:hypothetical protein
LGLRGTRKQENGENYITKSLCSVLLTDQIKKNEMGRAYSKNGGDERCLQEFSGESRGKETIEMTQA